MALALTHPHTTEAVDPGAVAPTCAAADAWAAGAVHIAIVPAFACIAVPSGFRPPHHAAPCYPDIAEMGRFVGREW